MKFALPLVAALCILFSSVVRAQIPVIDGANLIQNTLTAARTLEEINNQIKQLANEARNLTTLPFDIVSQLRATIALATQLITQAQGIAFQLSQTQTLLNRFYPATYAPGVTGAAMTADSYQRWLHTLQSLYTSITMQSQAAQNLASDENSLATLVAQSQSAIGILQGAQATNQLLALHARQMIQEQQLKLTQDRSAALEQARNVVAEARAREVRRRFEGSGVTYTAQPIHFYGF